MFVTNWISTTKIQKISEITNFFRHYFLSRTEVVWGGDAFRRDKAKVGRLPALTGKRASSPKEKKVKKKEADDSDS